MEPVAFAALAAPGPAASEPLTTQIYRAARDAIRAGRVPAGVRLPSSRAAAAALGVSRNTVVAAYDLLRAEGVVEARQGAAPVVLAVEAAVPTHPAAPRVSLGPRGAALGSEVRAGLYSAPAGLFMPGSPDETLFPRAAWAAALRRAALRLHGRAAGYGDYPGLPALREVLAARLAADRGLVVAPEQVIVVAGAQAAFTLCAQVLAEPGMAGLVETPGYAGARAAFAGAGLRLSPLPVDASGADIAGADPDAALAYVTPSNQYPLGLRMTLARREALVAWARARSAWIVEDDYDSEFHWRGRAIAAMQALAPDVTVYVGSASKALLPALRVAWLVAPAPLAAPLAQAARNLGLGANLHAQAALAELMETGGWRAQIRRIASAYEARGRLLADALEARLGDRLTVHRPDGGLQMAVAFRDAGAEGEAMAALGAAGFAVAALSRYGLDEPAQAGLLIGFADADAGRVARFCAVLDGCLGSAQRDNGCVSRSAATV